MAPYKNHLSEKVLKRCHNICFHQEVRTRAPHAGANARLQLLLENCKSKRGHTYVKKFENYIPYWYGNPTGIGFPFGS